MIYFEGLQNLNCLYWNFIKDILENHGLIERLKHSDKTAFNELFSHYYKRLCRFAYIILKCEQSAEEIVQDVFVKLWEKREKLSICLNLDSYLFISVKNSSLNMIKFNHIRKNFLENENTLSTDDSETIDTAAFLIHLEKAITKLPEQCRIIYYLKSFEGLTHDEIANYLDISSKTVENQVRIAMGKLREMLFKYKDSFYTKDLWRTANYITR